MIPALDDLSDLGFSCFDVLGKILRDNSFDDRLGGGAGEGVASIG